MKKIFIVISLVIAGLKSQAADLELRITVDYLSQILTTKSVKGHLEETKNSPGCRADKISVDLMTLNSKVSRHANGFKEQVKTAKYPDLILTDLEGHSGRMSGNMELAGVKVKFDRVPYAFNKKTNEIELALKSSLDTFKVLSAENKTMKGLGNNFDFVLSVPIKLVSN